MRDIASALFKTPARSFVLIALVCVGAFAPVLGGDFKGMDDEFSIVANADLRSFESLPRIFTSGYFKGRDYYRPLVNTTYLVEYQTFGLRPFFYYLDNILLHILSAWLVMLIAGHILGDRHKAWWVALLFAVHPLQWEALGNISGRAILLSAPFALGALLLFLRYLKEPRGLLLVGSVACYAAGLLCKESAAVTLIVMALYALLNGRRDWRIFVPFATVIVLYALWRAQLGLTQVLPWRNHMEMMLGFISFLNGILTYLRLILVPAGLYFDRSQPMFLSFLAPGLWATMAVYAAAGLGLFVWRARIAPVVWLCTAWFFIELLPVSQIMTSIGVHAGAISLAEHFLYMALIPATILMVLGAGRGVDWLEARGVMQRRVSHVAIGGLVALLVLTSLQQALYASNEAAMLKRSLSMNVYNGRVHAAMGMVYVRVEDYKKAEQHFRAAVVLDPAEPRYRISLGKSMADQGRYQEALDEYARIKDPKGWQKLLDENTAGARVLLEQERLSP